MKGAARCIISIKIDLPDRFHVIQKCILPCTTTYITSDRLYYFFLSSNCTCNSKDNEQYSSRACIASYATELGFPVEIFWLFNNATPQVTIYVIIFASRWHLLGYLFKICDVNTRPMTAIMYVVLVSLLSTLNKFHTSFWCFLSWL